MEATAAAASASDRQAAADERELALRFGAVLLYVLGSDDGGVVRAIDETGLAFAEMKTLFAIAGPDEPAPMKSVAERTGLSLPSASRAVDGLVKRGIATRVEDTHDRRVRRVSLTRKGRELADRLTAARVAGLERFVGSLSGAERRKLESAVAALVEREDIARIYRSHARRARR